MKRLLLLIAPILALAVTSCKEEPFLSVNPYSLSFDQAGGSQTITVSANYAWTAKASGSGFSISPSAGEGSGTVTVTAGPASSPEEAKGNILIMSEGLSASVDLSQAAKSTISVGSGFTAPAEGGTFTVDVQYNVSMKVEVEASAAGWLKFVQTKALTSGKLEFSVAANDSYDERSAKVTVADASGKAAPVEIVIKQEARKALIVGAANVVPAEGGSFEVDIQYNTEFKVVSDVSWIKYIRTKALTSGKLEFEVAANDTYEEREGKVTVSDVSGKVAPVEIIVSQGFARPEYASGYLTMIFGYRQHPEIKEINFHVDSDVTTDKCIKTDAPIYYSVSDSAIDIYTPAHSIKPVGSLTFEYFPSVETLDLTNLDFSELDYLFFWMDSVKSIKFGTGKKYKFKNVSRMFAYCYNLENVDVSIFDVSECENFEGVFYSCKSLKSIDLTGWDTGKGKSFVEMFWGCLTLEEIDVSMFNTSNAETMAGMFENCPSLKRLDLTSFDTTNLKSMGVMFNGDTSLSFLDLSSFNLSSTCDTYNTTALVGRDAGLCTIRCSAETFVALADAQGYLVPTIKWELTTPYQEYQSSSFAQDGKVTLLQAASKGPGLDIVLMGDAYSDRMVDSGLYDRDINLTMEAIFSQEPMKSYRDYFNVYEVTLVSKNEYIFLETALSAKAFPAFCGDDEKVMGYVRKALGADCSLDNVTVGVLVRTKTGGGTTYFPLDNVWRESDYGIGGAIAYFGIGDNIFAQDFTKCVVHELVGHGFAKLGDEYCPTSGSAEDWWAEKRINQRQQYGYWKNVDYTGDPSNVYWSKFINDPRYASEEIGVYEGAENCRYGAWRPTYNSVMNEIMPLRLAFNAPSREAIYNRINKLVYGEDWEYDYETFVKFDLKL